MKKLYFLIIFIWITVTPSFAIELIVNLDNPITQIKKKDAKRIFLLKKKSWNSRNLIVPVNLPADHPARKEFSKEVFGKSVSKLESYYLKRALSGKGQPPRVLKTEKDVIDFVSKNVNAIGYVSRADKSVKVILIK